MDLLGEDLDGNPIAPKKEDQKFNDDGEDEF